MKVPKLKPKRAYKKSPGEPLTEAVEANKTLVAELLVARGARVFPQWEYRSLLHTAAKNNNPALLKLFLASGYTVDQTWSNAGQGRTALAWAAKHGSCAAAELLIAAGADVDSQIGAIGARGLPDTPLLSAVMNGSVGVTQALLAAGADLEIGTSVYNYWRRGMEVNQTALQVALIQASRTQANTYRPWNHIEVVKILLEGGAHLEDEDIFKSIPQWEGYDRRFGGEPELLKYLLDAGVSVNITNEKGETPLMVASRGGFVRSVRLLLAAGANLDIQDDDNTTALLQAKMSAKLIDESGSTPWYERQYGRPSVKLQHKRHCVVIEDLLAAGAEDLPLNSISPSIKDNFCTEIGRNGSAPDCPYSEHCEEWTPLRAAAFYGCPEQLTELIADELHPIPQDSPLGSLLYTAASEGNTAVVQMLSDPSLQLLEVTHPSSKETPLDAAVRNCHVEVVRVLMAAGADARHLVGGVPLLHRLIRGDTVCDFCHKKPMQILEAIVGSDPTEEVLEQTDEGLNTPLIYAVKYIKNHFLKQLVTLGANVNYRGARTESLCPRGRRELPQPLCPFVWTKCPQNQTALHWALANNDLDAVKILRAGGANPELKDRGCEGRMKMSQPFLTSQQPMSPMDHAEKIYKHLSEHLRVNETNKYDVFMDVLMSQMK